MQWRTNLILLCVALGAIEWAGVLVAPSPAPHIFYSDLESAPNTGGENNAGAIVTIYGKNFGETRGDSFVTIGKGFAANYKEWTDTKIALQLGAKAETGSLTVHAGKKQSNSAPFMVRAGRIAFVSPKGSDHANGDFFSPWKTILKARNSSKPGDVIYLMDGISQVVDDGTGWSAALTLGANDCGSVLPRALVAYPGATATIGGINGPPVGIRASNPSERGGACAGGWVFAGLTLRGQSVAIALEGPSNNWRLVDNDISCPNGDGATACVETSRASHIQFFGNNVHDAGKADASALYHGVYFSTDSNHIDMGWNTVANIRGCRGVQIHSSPLHGGGPNDPTGHNQYDISIHDNVIHDTQCDGIVFATVDPSQGKIEAYNNIIYNAGQGPSNPEKSGNWSCIYVAGTTNTGPSGGGTVEIYNNTLAQCGTFAKPPYDDARASVMNGEHNPNLAIRLRDNIFYQPNTVPYIVGRGFTGSHNLVYGNGSLPLAQSLHQNPMFVDAGHDDFHLASNSPARHTGTETESSFDKDGIPRGGSAGHDVGAFQYSEAAPLSDEAAANRK